MASLTWFMDVINIFTFQIPAIPILAKMVERVDRILIQPMVLFVNAPSILSEILATCQVKSFAMMCCSYLILIAPNVFVAVVRPCDSDPCLNGGTCIDEDELLFRCECPDRFEGERCEIEIGV